MAAEVGFGGCFTDRRSARRAGKAARIYPESADDPGGTVPRGRAKGVRAHLRVPGQRGGFRTVEGPAGRHGLYLHRRQRAGGSGAVQHLRRAGTRPGPGVRQRGGAEAHQRTAPPHEDRAVRLHDAAAPRGGAHQAQLSLRGSGVRHLRHPPAAGAAVSDAAWRQTGVRDDSD